MQRATFDPVDAAIPDAHAHWLSLPDSVRTQNFRQSFQIDPTGWDKHLPDQWGLQLSWDEFRYAGTERETLDQLIQSDEPGIYIFYARPAERVFHFPAFAFYVGISGEGGSNRPLRDRLKDYLPANIASIRKRKRVHLMLQLYYNHLWVAYALAGSNAAHLPTLEEQLHGYLYPCFAERDFPVEIKRQQRAFSRV